MPNTHQSWLSNISASPAYLYRDHFYCEHCALDNGNTTKPNQKLSVQSVNPVGPINRVITENPTHCASETFCLKPVNLPDGSRIGCPLKVELTNEGFLSTTMFVASHMLYGSRSQKAIGRLWLQLVIQDFGHPPLALLSKTVPKKISSNSHMKKLTSSGVNLTPHVFTNLFALYGGALSPSATILWRIGLTDDGKLDKLLTVSLPPSEAIERPMSDLLEEAIDAGAWE
jgi:hypothetical protein